MTLSLAIIIILTAGIAFLVVFLVKNVIIPRRAAAAISQQNRSKLLRKIRSLKALIEKDPQNVEARYMLGKAYLADKREEQAFREYRSAARMGIIGKNIPEMEFRETLATLYAKFHEEEEALKEYILLIKSHPENADYYFQAGRLFSNRNRPDLAEQYLRRAVMLNPNDELYRFELGHHYFLGKKIKEAGAEFEAALKLSPEDGQILIYLGKVHKEAKEFTLAIPYLEKAARNPEHKLRALVELGSCCMSLRMLDRAVEELERAVACIEKEAEPDSLYARYFLAMCFEKQQEFTKAIAQWDKIYAQKKNFRDVGEKLTQYIEYRQEAEKDTQRKF